MRRFLVPSLNRADGPNETTTFDPRVSPLDIDNGNFGYRALAAAIEQHPGFNYLYTNDVR